MVENGFTCTGGDESNPDICSEQCGDGFVIVDTLENCDDGNLIDDDG